MAGRMAERGDSDRKNDAKFLTPPLLMALLLACGILLFAYSGHTLAAAG